jgi:hypothetical protein
MREAQATAWQPHGGARAGFSQLSRADAALAEFQTDPEEDFD